MIFMPDGTTTSTSSTIIINDYRQKKSGPAEWDRNSRFWGSWDYFSKNIVGCSFSLGWTDCIGVIEDAKYYIGYDQKGVSFIFGSTVYQNGHGTPLCHGSLNAHIDLFTRKGWYEWIPDGYEEAEEEFDTSGIEGFLGEIGVMNNDRE